MADESEPAGDDLDAVTAAFEAAIGSAHKPVTQPTIGEPTIEAKPAREPAAAPPESKPSLFGEYKSRYAPPAPVDPRDAEIGELREFREIVRRWGGTIDQERAQAREAAEAQAVLAYADQRVAEFPELPNGYGGMWLKNQYQLDGALQAAWQNRHASPEAMEHARATVARTLRQLDVVAKKEASRIASIPLNADREAVSMAVRGASIKASPPPPPPSPGKMTDKEFADYTQKNFGYIPRGLEGAR